MEERLSNLEKFQVLLLAKHSVATYEEVFEIGGELDDYLYRAWREMKRATLEEGKKPRRLRGRGCRRSDRKRLPERQLKRIK